MTGAQWQLLVLGIVGCLSVECSGHGEHSRTPENFPRFSWSTLPVFWHAWAPEPFNASTLDFINRFPLVTIEKGMSRDEAPAGRDAELKIVAAAEQVKKRNSTIKVLFYLNSLMDWHWYELHQYCLQHKELMWAFDKHHQPVTLRGEMVFNMSSKEVRQVWVNVLKHANESGWIDGAFVDRGGDPLINEGRFKDVEPEKFHQLVLGHRQLMVDLQQAFGDGFLSVANHQDYNATTGRMFERFMLGADHAQAYSDLLLLMHETSYPHIAEVHIEPCNAVTYNTTLAGYLIGAGKYAYYGCTDGFSTFSGWLNWPEDYSKQLGEPTSNASTISTTTGYCKKSHATGWSEGTWEPITGRPVYNHFWTEFRHHAMSTTRDRHILNDWVRDFWRANPEQSPPVFGRKFSSGTCVTLDYNEYPPASCIAWSDGTHTGSSTSCLV